MMAYVREPYAANYKFTSAMPAQLLKALAPALLPLLNENRGCGAGTKEGLPPEAGLAPVSTAAR
jgi:hypothetical protein